MSGMSYKLKKAYNTPPLSHRKSVLNSRKIFRFSDNRHVLNMFLRNIFHF